MAGEASSAAVPPGVGGEQDKFANAGRIVEGECLRDESAHRPSEHAYSLELERLDHPRRVAGEFGDVELRSIVVGAADAAVVEQDDLVCRLLLEKKKKH